MGIGGAGILIGSRIYYSGGWRDNGKPRPVAYRYYAEKLVNTSKGEQEQIKCARLRAIQCSHPAFSNGLCQV